MMFTRTNSGSAKNNVGRTLIASTSLVVIASFVAAPAASAGAKHSGATHAQVAPKPTRHPAPQHHPATKHTAPAKVTHRAAKARAFGLTKPKHVKAHFANVARPAKPAAVPAHKNKLWTGTPSYSLVKNNRVSPAAIPGVTGSCQVTAGNHFGTWSPASCPKGYEVQGDVTVPVGKTLTIKPNTVVYFDTALQGSLGVGDPSQLPDLIVDGTLTVAGTAKHPVTLTAATAAPASTTSPEAGDWGYVFFNHTGPNKGNGSMNHMRLMYGQGVAADRAAPPILNSTISNIAAGNGVTIAPSITPNAGIDYEDITGGTVVLDSDTFDGAEVAGIKLASYWGHTAFNGAAVPGNPFKVSLTNSSITGGNSSGFEDAVYIDSETDGANAATNHAAVSLDVHGNTINQTSDGYGLAVYAETNSSTLVGTAAVTGSIRDNVIVGGDSSYGVYLYSYAADSKAKGTKTCGGAASCVIASYLRNQIGAYYVAVENDAEVANGSGKALVNTPVGQVVKKKKHHKTKLVDVSGGTYQSNDDDTWQSYAENYGTGPATSLVPIVASHMFSYDYSVYAEAESYQNNAVNSVTARHSNMTSTDNDNIYVETYGADNAAPPTGVAGSGATNVVLTGGRYAAYDYNIDNDDTTGYYGPGASNISVNGAKLTSATGYNYYGYTYGSYSGGQGGGTGNVNIHNSTLDAYEGNIENYVYGYHGKAPAGAGLSITGSTLNAYDDDNVENYAYSAYATGSHGASTATHVVKNSTLHSYYSNLDVGAYAYYGGSATSSPQVVNSKFYSSDDYGIENYVEADEYGGNGTATGNPSFTKSTVEAEYDVIYNSVTNYYGSGTATGNPSITKSTTFASDDYTIDNEVTGTDQTGSSGKAVGNPIISGGKATAESSLIYNDVSADYAAAAGNPVLQNVKGLSGDDYGIENDVYGSETAGSGAATCSPLVTGSNIHTYDYTIYNDCYSYGGKATGNPVISTSRVVASDDYSVYNEVYANYQRNTGATATANPQILNSVVVSYDEAIYNESYGYQGPAVANFVVKNSQLTITDDDAFENYAYGSYSGNTGSATASPVITGSTIKAYDYGLYNYAYGYHGKATANPVISKSPIATLFDAPIENDAEGGYSTAPGAATANPTVVNSELTCGYCSSEYGFDNYAYSRQSAATANPVMTNTPMTISEGYGVYNEAESAQNSGQGAATANPVIKSSPLTAYYYALYNYADAENGNSPADASFTMKDSRAHSLDYDVIDAEAFGSGTGTSTTNPRVDNMVLRSPDDGGPYLEAESAGTGASHVGGHINTSKIISEYYGVDVEASPSGVGSPSTFDTTFRNDNITVTDYEGIYADNSVKGASMTVAPKIIGGKIDAVDDYAVDLEANGYGGAATDALRVTPTIQNVSSTSDDGFYLQAADNNGSPAPGRTIIGGSITGGNIVSTSDDGIYAYSHCTYCTGGAKAALSVSNIPIESYDAAGYFAARTESTSPGSATLSGSATSSKHSSWNSQQDYGIESYAQAGNGNAVNSFTIAGLHISAYYNPIYNYADATGGSASNSSSIVGNVIDNQGGDSDEDGIDESTDASGGTNNAARTGTISNNVIRNIPEGSDGIDETLSAPGLAVTKLTIAHNLISNMGSEGIYVSASSGATPGSAYFVTVSHNTITRTGDTGVYLYGVRPNINHNKISAAGLAGSGSDLDGVYVDNAPAQGTVTCNVIWGNALGVEYGTGNPTSGAGGHNGDPKTNRNSFKAPKSSVRNSTDLKSSNASASQTDAQSNFWGGSPRLYPPASDYDTTPRLSKAPKCVAKAGV